MPFPYSEFSRFVDLSQEDFNVPKTIEATTKECHDLAQRFDLVNLQHLCVSYTITQKEEFEDIYTAIVQFRAVIWTQQDPVESKEIHEEILCRFYPDSKPIRDNDAWDINIDIDFHEDGKVDIGEIAAQYIFIVMNDQSFNND